MTDQNEPAQPSSEPAQPAEQSVPAGWYTDPSGTGGTRWWDGTAWTEHVQPPAAAVPPPPPPPAAPAAPAYGSTPAAGSSGPAYGSTPAWGATPSYAGVPGAAPAYSTGFVQPRRVGFADAVTRAFKGIGDYSSRATVAEYWWFVLFNVLVAAAVYAVSLAVLAATSSGSSANGTSTGGSGVAVALGVILLVLLVVGYIVLFLAQLALTVRRLHDTDKSGWWYLITFVPFGSIVLLVFTVLPGTPGPNRFGPVPQ